MALRWTSQAFIDGTTGDDELVKDATSSTHVVDRFVHKSVQISGTFGGATVIVQGRIGEAWFSLLSKTEAGIFDISASVRQLRVTISGGDATTAIAAMWAGFDTRVAQ